MFDFHEKRKIRSVLYSKPVAFGMFFCAVLLGVSVYDRLQVVREIQDKIEVKQDELSRLESRAQTLQSKVEYLENDRGVEEEIRSRFDVARAGEQVVVLVDDVKEKGNSGTTSLRAEEGLKDQKKEQEEEKGFFDLFKFW